MRRDLHMEEVNKPAAVRCTGKVLGANFQRLPVQLQYHCLVCERQLGEEKKPRWAVSELKTGRFRGVAKVCAAMAPICTAGCVMQYRLSIQNFERVGGILKQTLSMLAKESGEELKPNCWSCDQNLLDLDAYLRALQRTCIATTGDRGDKAVVGKIASTLTALVNEIEESGGKVQTQIKELAAYLAWVSVHSSSALRKLERGECAGATVLETDLGPTANVGEARRRGPLPEQLPSGTSTRPPPPGKCQAELP
eukprot:g31224.t1